MIDARTLPLAIVVSALVGCSPLDPVAEDHTGPQLQAAAVSAQDPERGAQEFVPPEPDDTASDWLKLKSGEWLRGSIESLRDGTIEFESDELDTQVLDWDDVAELRSPRQQTVLLDDGRSLVGTLLIRDGTVTVGGASPQTFPSRRLLSIVPGDATEGGVWSGKLSLGITTRSGNTREVDTSGYLFLRRETAATRWDSSYNGAFSRVEGVRTADNHRLRSRFDWYLSKHLFVTLAGLDLFNDPFQNVRLRTTPYAALGYDFVDTKDLSWRVSAGPAYQHTRFQSVSPGGDDSSDTAAAVVSTKADWDITSDVELELSYDLTIPIPATHEFNHHLVALLSVDLIADFDLDVTLVWDRVNDPPPDDLGIVPEQDDFRVTLGIGWDF